MLHSHRYIVHLGTIQTRVSAGGPQGEEALSS